MWKVICVFMWSVLLILGCFVFSGKVRFGYGLGDIIYGFFLIIVSFVGFVLTFKVMDKKSVAFFSFFIFGIVLLLITVLRGSESPWDGNVFF